MLRVMNVVNTLIYVLVISFRKSPKICSRSNINFGELTFDFQVQLISFVERKANSTMEHQKCKGHETRNRLLVSKMEFNYRFPSGI